MPDGDKFERSLRGKGWRKAYRQACGGAPPNMLRDTLLGAAAAALRGPLACNSLPRVRDAVYQALKEKARSGELNFSDQGSADPFRMLSDLLSDIVADDANSVSTQLAAKAALSMYIELESVCDSVTSKRIQNRLGEKFGENVIRNQWLARVREGIAQVDNRSAEDQMAWEETLFTQLAQPISQMVGQMFRSDQKGTIRAPRRTTPQRKMTIEELHTGIAVQEI